MLNKKKILLSSGGTGGHVIPAVNLGNFLLDQGLDCSIIIDKRGEKYIKNFKGKYYLINSNHLTGGNFLLKIKSAISLFLGAFQSLLIVLKFKPNCFISFGGYATSMPILIALLFKSLFKIRIGIHEQNAVIGNVNLFFLPYVDYFFSNFNEIRNLKKNLFYKKIHSGLPQSIKINIKLSNINHIKEKKIILIYGGSQGSLFIIKQTLLIFENLDPHLIKNIKFIIQCPKEISENLKNSFIKLGINFIIKEFYDNMDEILKISDFAIARSGAGTINDLITYKIPSILLPLPNSINNHQFFNAKFLADRSAAIILEEKNFKTDLFLKTFNDLVTNNIKIKYMKKSLNDIKPVNANLIILNKILNEI